MFFSQPDCEHFQISVESEAVKIKGKYLSKDVTTLNFNNNLSANLWWKSRTAVTPLCILNSQKINLGINIFLSPILSMLFFLVYWYLYKFKSGKLQDLLSIMKVIKVYQEIYSIQLVLASVTMLNVSMPVKVEWASKDWDIALLGRKKRKYKYESEW